MVIHTYANALSVMPMTPLGRVPLRLFPIFRRGVSENIASFFVAAESQ